MRAAETTAPAGSSSRVGVTTLTFAAWSSLGAGAIHAAAIGVHAEHRQTALVFTAVAVFQLGWGAVALAVQDRVIAIVGGVGNALLVGGWMLSHTSGIGFVDGLEVAGSAQTTDTLAAILAGVVVLSCTAAMFTRRDHNVWRPVGRLSSILGVLAVVGLTLPALVGASDHAHYDDGAAAGGHDHDDDQPGDGGRPDDDSAVGAAAGDDHGEHEAAAVPPKPYDPDLPIDLGGVAGVTPQQQAAAENLIAVTLMRLPQFADPTVAEAGGFRSIGDGFTGHEHYVNRDYIDDGRILDPDHPESLVYEVRDGRKTLVAAMYMLGSDKTLDDVPELGGALTQWHVHGDLCFTDEPEAPLVRGLTNAEGECDPPLVKGIQVPMIHVWTVPHECGPFASLEGVAGGQIAEGEQRLCDHAHGA